MVRLSGEESIKHIAREIVYHRDGVVETVELDPQISDIQLSQQVVGLIRLLKGDQASLGLLLLRSR